MSRTETLLSTTTKYKAVLISLCVLWFLSAPAAVASAQESRTADSVSGVVALLDDGASSGFDFTRLPPIDSINAQTDITVFLRTGVPERMRVAALRRVWVVDPAIRDFRELSENDWDFNDADTILGFGENYPELAIEKYLARLFSEPQRVVVASLPRRAQLFGFVLPFAWN